MRNRSRFLLFFHVSLCLSAAFLPATSFAEIITVGPSGCDQTTLAGAIIRAAVTPESDTILFGANVTWTGGGALLLTNESPVTFQGVSSCSNFSAVQRTITATVGDLFEFDNTQATFRDLRLLGDTAGRLITATSSSIVTLEDSLLLGGRADDGGNVHLSGGASLLALAGSQIFNGEATFDGGGVFCTGGGVVGLGEETKLHNNNAGRNGGGVYVEGCSLNILAGGPGPPGINQYGIVDNRAEFNGGGVYARGEASVLLSGNGSHPGSIVSNDAVGIGGGMYLTGLGTIAEVFNSEIADNRGFGLAGGVSVTLQANFLMHRTVANCDRGVRCSRLEGNQAGIGSAGIQEGGALRVTSGAEAFVRQTYVSGNGADDGGNVAVVSGGGSFVLFEGSVLYDNNRTGVHVIARDGAWVRLAFVSAWGSSAPGFGSAFAEVGDNARVDLYSSILIEGQGSTIGPGTGPDPVFLPLGTGATINLDCMLVHENVSTGGEGSVVTDPASQWESPMTGDPHLRAGALAIDFCDTLVYSPMDDDIDGEARGVDDPAEPDALGPFDLGADERIGPPEPEPIFSDGFESGDVSAWSGSAP